LSGLHRVKLAHRLEFIDQFLLFRRVYKLGDKVRGPTLEKVGTPGWMRHVETCAWDSVLWIKSTNTLKASSAHYPARKDESWFPVMPYEFHGDEV
jgi:hypothetical protein